MLALLQALFMIARVLTAASTTAVRVGFLQNSHVMGRLGRTSRYSFDSRGIPRCRRHRASNRNL
jgi:hypothetical protein